MTKSDSLLMIITICVI